MLIYKKSGEHTYDLINEFNKKFLGTLVMDVDGYYYYWPSQDLSGSWSSDSLLEISKILDELNDDYNKKVRNYFGLQIIFIIFVKNRGDEWGDYVKTSNEL